MFFFFIISFIKGGAPAPARGRERARGGPDVLAPVGLPLADRVLSTIGRPTDPPTVQYGQFENVGLKFQRLKNKAKLLLRFERKA